MKDIGIVTFLLIAANGLVTYKGLKSFTYRRKYAFDVDQILGNKDYKRLITSGFLHVDWRHFFFNMLTLYFFSGSLEGSLGVPVFLVLYFASLVGGNLLALYFHRNHLDYRAVGASGAVSGLVFASIGLYPGLEIGFILFPIFFPAWIYGIGYVLYSIYGIKSHRDNIGHEAHLGGGIVGLLVAIMFYPNIMVINTFPIALILIPSLVFLILIIKIPHILMVDKPFGKPKGNQTIEDKYNTIKLSKQSELDNILDKINTQGLDKLTQHEKDRLKELSK